MNVHIPNMPKKDNKKELIIESALRLFATQGYASTPVSLIAKTAGVSQGLMYNFFSSKEELLREMISLGARDIAESMESYLTATDAKSAIRHHVLKTVEIVRQRKEFWRLLHAIRLQGLVIQVVEDQFQEITARVTATFEKIFRQLRYPDPALEAILFLTQIDGLVILYLQEETIPIKKLADHLIKRYAS
jgi:AcrR family transcriptional regulator